MEPKKMGSGVFSNSEIFKSIDSGQIVCQPFEPEHVNTTSLDVRLGEHYYRIADHREDSIVLNPFDEEHIASHFEYKRAAPLYQALGSLVLGKMKNYPLNHPVIPLRPGERILGHTYEFVGIATEGTTSMQARSTVGRSGINVCQDAGWGDTGYINRWTMEIYNNNDRHVLLPVGWRIAQIVFHHSQNVQGEYSTNTGKYQANSAGNISDIINSWRPTQMLPRAYKDEIKPYTPLRCD
jgi:dCTP deaminase